jgi:hypothetical protein
VAQIHALEEKRTTVIPNASTGKPQDPLEMVNNRLENEIKLQGNLKI